MSNFTMITDEKGLYEPLDGERVRKRLQPFTANFGSSLAA